MPVRQAPGAWPIGLAAGRGGRCGAEPGTTVDAAEGDRLADAAANLAARAGRLSCPAIRLRQIHSAIGLRSYAAMDLIHCERADHADNLPDDLTANQCGLPKDGAVNAELSTSPGLCKGCI